MWPFTRSKRTPQDETIVPVPVDEPKPEPEVEWVWVDGFKGMSKTMTGHGDFQFEVGKTYTVDDYEEVKRCDHGFHFSLCLNDVFNYYGFDFEHRYFRVSGLVRKSELDQYGLYNHFGWHISKCDKLVAKEIVIKDEVEPDIIFGAIKGTFPALESVEEMQSIKSIESYGIFQREKAFAEVRGNYSKVFFMILTEGLTYLRIRLVAEYLSGLSEQGVSPDMAAYMATEYVNAHRSPNTNVMTESYLNLIPEITALMSR